MNIGSSHESRAHGDAENTRNDPAKMKLHKYHPDLPEIRKSYAKYADAVENMDKEVQATIDALKEDGLYDDTIIIYNSDHGGVMPRSKRFVYSTGIHCPLVIRIPEKWKEIWPAEAAGSTVDRLVSFVDMPKTWVSLAGGDLVNTLQGTVFLGEGTEPEPAYHFAFRERADDRIDHVRVLRTKRYAYHKNYMPYAPAGQYLAYMWKINAAPAWEQYFAEGKADAITGRFFRPRVSEEFYDNAVDFDNVNNLIDDPKYQDLIGELKSEMRRKQLELFDSGLLPEQMRAQRARDNNMTIYDMVRDPNLYPLEKYLDAADLALARDKANLQQFIRDLSDPDSGLRFWAVTGLLLLDADAAPAAAALQETLDDAYIEVSSLAAWVLYKIGNKAEASEALYDMLVSDKGGLPLYNVLDWMGDDSDAILERFAREYAPKATLLKDIITRRGIEIVSGRGKEVTESTTSATVIPGTAFSTGEGSDRTRGLRAEYFDNVELEGEPAFVKVDEKIDFDWGKQAPGDLPQDAFAIRWTGKVTPAKRGIYTFVSYCDDGSRLWINDKLVIDNWQGGRAKDVSGNIRLGAKPYDIRMEYFEHRGGAIAQLKWIAPE